MVIQVLYQSEMAHDTITEALTVFADHFETSEKIRIFAVELIRGVESHLAQIDSLIRQFSEHWRLERMPVVDRNIIRLGVFELLYRSDIPAKVSINEAVDLGKKFGSEDSGSFINGILDRVRLHLEGVGKDDNVPGTDPASEQEVRSSTEVVGH
jgi:N utilization substance protein B